MMQTIERESIRGAIYYSRLDLIVRLAGYSAGFIELSQGVQDDIIRRSEVVV